MLVLLGGLNMWFQPRLLIIRTNCFVLEHKRLLMARLDLKVYGAGSGL